ncbi:unnamed protein product [Rotaria sp. Silwood2]|nr:unnamed protein product [Rotaria sp. Silwood2]CAF2856120.1 unnamed protein product [Rotaria sp. Silwood2]CAF3120613.1 unnamed protein product [Rotaria sp. Silwood2]CAF3301271.1 unnamed protein product [Rotaria sp. Silwood2]CAF4246928.1 unnamed protein product [Rotaria sp. Silwood2]
MSSDSFLTDLLATKFTLDKLEKLYIDALQRKKTLEGMIDRFDTRGEKELSTNTEYYLNKSELQIQMVHTNIQYICMTNKYDFNSIIDLLKSQIDKQDVDHSNDLESIHSLSSYIVDVSEDGSTEELEVDPFARDHQPTAVNCSQQRSSSFRGRRSSIKGEEEYLTQYENRDRCRPNTRSRENHYRPNKEPHQSESTLSSSSVAPTTVASIFESVVGEPNMEVQQENSKIEDTYTIALQRLNRSDKESSISLAYFDIFDGHGGKEAAEVARQNLCQHILEQDDFWSEISK